MYSRALPAHGRREGQLGAGGPASAKISSRGSSAEPVGQGGARQSSPNSVEHKACWRATQRRPHQRRFFRQRQRCGERGGRAGREVGRDGARRSKTPRSSGRRPRMQGRGAAAGRQLQAQGTDGVCASQPGRARHHQRQRPQGGGHRRASRRRRGGIAAPRFPMWRGAMHDQVKSAAVIRANVGCVGARKPWLRDDAALRANCLAGNAHPRVLQDMRSAGERAAAGASCTVVAQQVTSGCPHPGAPSPPQRARASGRGKRSRRRSAQCMKWGGSVVPGSEGMAVSQAAAWRPACDRSMARDAGLRAGSHSNLL